MSFSVTTAADALDVLRDGETRILELPRDDLGSLADM